MYSLGWFYREHELNYGSKFGCDETYKIVANSVDHENHFLLQLSSIIVLRADFPVSVQELLESLVFGRKNELDYGHEEIGLGATGRVSDLVAPNHDCIDGHT